mgnify:FL=1
MVNFYTLMETLCRVVDCGQLVEREWAPEGGESRSIASVEVTISNGIDEMRVEATDELARKIAKDGLDENGLYCARIRMQTRKSKDKGIVFNSLRLLELKQL